MKRTPLKRRKPLKPGKWNKTGTEKRRRIRFKTRFPSSCGHDTTQPAKTQGRGIGVANSMGILAVLTLKTSLDAIWSQKVLERDGFRCRACGKPFPIRFLHAHHIIPRKRSANTRTLLDNGMTLCGGFPGSCHDRWHDRKQFADEIITSTIGWEWHDRIERLSRQIVHVTLDWLERRRDELNNIVPTKGKHQPCLKKQKTHNSKPQSPPLCCGN